MKDKSKKYARVARMYELYDGGKTLEEVGAEFGLSRQRIKTLFDDCGYKTRGRKYLRRRSLKNNMPILPKEKLEKLYLEEKRSLVEISEILKVNYNVLSHNFKEYGTPKRSRREVQSPRLKNPALTVDKLSHLYLVENWSSGQIAKTFGYNPETIKNRLSRLGIRKSDAEDKNKNTNYQFNNVRN